MDNLLDITPKEFEISVQRFLDEQGKVLKDFETDHLEMISGSDGDYEFDVTARFEALGADFLVLIECKRYASDPIERAEVQILNQKRISVGAHKAMLFTTSTFRSGAIDFAAKHRIALVEVERNKITYAVKSILDRWTFEVVEPSVEPLSEYLFKGEISVEQQLFAESKEAQMQALKIAILRQSLDYSLILASKGCDIDEKEIDARKAEIREEKTLLQRMIENEA